MANVIRELDRPTLDHLAQQDARRAALLGVQAVLPAQRGRVFRQLLRLLPAGGLHSAHRHLHREGFVDQRGDRAAAAFRDQRAALAAGHDRGRERLVHLRPGFAGGLPEHAADGETRPADHARGGARRSWWTCSTSATTSLSAAANSACAATSSKCIRRTADEEAIRIEFFGDEIDRDHALRSAHRPRARSAERDHASIPAKQFVTPARQDESRAHAYDPRRAGRADRRVRITGQTARGAAAEDAHRIRPRDDAGDGLLQRDRELLAALSAAARRARRRSRCSIFSRTIFCS